MGLTEQIQRRPLAEEAWARIRKTMQTHVMGKPPEWLFKTRRPLESKNEYALKYRLENFQPITKQPFLTAIGAVIDSANHIYVDEKNVNDRTREFISNFQIRVNGRSYSHKKFITTYVGKMIEIDPNAVLVHLPVHPTQEFIPDFREELPNFDAVRNQSVDIELQLIGSEYIHHISDDELWYYGGEYLVQVKDGKETWKPYYWMLSAEWTRLAIPYLDSENRLQYREEDYYLNDLEHVPFDVIGGNPVLHSVRVDDDDEELVELQDVTYSGAVAIANKLLGIDSDGDIVMTRFTYPEKIMRLRKCDAGCSPNYDPESPYYGLNVVHLPNSDSCSVCTVCRGTGMVLPDTSPLGAHHISESEWNDDGGIKSPIEFITPPLESPKFMSEEVETLYNRMEDALFIMHQNMNNQSGVSKGYDWREKVSVISGAVRNIYSVYQASLNTIQGFLRGAEDIELVLPPDFGVKNTYDITMELAESKETSSVYTSELTKELLLKKFGSGDVMRRIVEFMEIYDKLWGMTTDEILKLKAIYGAQLTARDQIIHDKGVPVLRRMARRDDFLDMDDSQLKEAFDLQIDILVPPPLVSQSPLV